MSDELLHRSDTVCEHLHHDPGWDPLTALSCVVWPTESQARLFAEINVERCRNGHPRTPENTYLTPSGQRRCRTCIAENEHRAERWHRRYRPCARCGKPCTNNPPRCRACFLEERHRKAA